MHIFQENLRTCQTKTINPLFDISNCHKIAIFCNVFDNSLLHLVCVLIFIHKDIFQSRKQIFLNRQLFHIFFKVIKIQIVFCFFYIIFFIFIHLEKIYQNFLQMSGFLIVGKHFFIQIKLDNAGNLFVYLLFKHIQNIHNLIANNLSKWKFWKGTFSARACHFKNILTI